MKAITFGIGIIKYKATYKTTIRRIAHTFVERTIVSLNEEFREEYEPGAAPLAERLESLRYLSERGCYTWVSIEPYPTPNIIEQDLDELLRSVAFADRIIFGRLHYNKIVSEYKGYQEFYNNCAKRVISFCTEQGISYHIKDGTLIEE